MDTQILQIRLCDQGTNGIWHTADTKLQTGTVRNLIHNIFGYGMVDICCCTATAKLVKICVGAFYDQVYIIDADTVVKSTQADWHILVDLNNYLFGGTDTSHCMGRTWSEIEVSVFIHWCYLKHCYIRRSLGIAVISRKLRVTDRSVETKAFCDCFTLDATHMPGIPGKVSCGIIDLENFQFFH